MNGFFAHPITFVVSHIIFPLLATGGLAHIVYLAWDAPVDGFKNRMLAVLVAAALCPIAALLRLLVGPKRIGCVTQIAFAFSAIAFVWLSNGTIGDAFSNIEGWALTATNSYCLWLAISSIVLAALGRIATADWPVEDGAAIGWSILAIIAGPCVLMLLSQVLKFSQPCDDLANFFLVLVSVVMIVGTVTLFLGIFRLLSHLTERLKTADEEGDAERTADLAFTLLFALALPFAGLALNLSIPFPADFANPWPWLFSALTTVFLALRAKTPRGRLIVFFLRLTMAPFVFYFFILFLPFLPLSIPAILLVGAGFLILAPTILFRWYTMKVLALWRRLSGEYSRARLIVTALAALALLPGLFVVDVELERQGVKELLAWHTGEDFSQSEKPYPMSVWRAKRVVDNLNDFAMGSEIPFLTAYRTYRVYGGMYMADQLREELNVRVNGKSSGLQIDDWNRSRNSFAAWTFGASAGRRANRGSVNQRITRPPKTEDFAEETGAITNGEYCVVYHVKNEDYTEREFVHDFTIPAGAWVVGMDLRMSDGSWKPARLSERKAAEWVYRKITERRRDPSIVTLDGPTRGRIKAFPIPHGGRDVRVRFRMSESEGEIIVASDAEVSVVSSEWMASHTNELVGITTPGERLAFDGKDPDVYRKLRRAARMAWERLPDELAEGKGACEFAITNGVLDKAKLAVLRKEFPGVAAFGDTPIDGWYLITDAEDKRVAVPYRANEGAVVFARLTGEGVVEASEGHWKDGAALWRLERTAFLNPALDLRGEILAKGRASGTLSDSTAYIALETKMQEKGLKQKELEALAADKSLDFEEPETEADAPSWVVMVIALIFVCLLRNLKRKLG